MAFNVEFRDCEGATVDFLRLDEEICRLWGTEPSPEHWATPPGKPSDKNWHAFLGLAATLLRAVRLTGDFDPTDLLKALTLYGPLRPDRERIESYIYEIQMILYWTKQEYTIKIENR